MRNPSDTVQFRLRLPKELRRKIEAICKPNRYSINAEIVRRLEESFFRDDKVEFAEHVSIAALNRLRLIESLRSSD